VAVHEPYPEGLDEITALGFALETFLGEFEYTPGKSVVATFGERPDPEEPIQKPAVTVMPTTATDEGPTQTPKILQETVRMDESDEKGWALIWDAEATAEIELQVSASSTHDRGMILRKLREKFMGTIDRRYGIDIPVPEYYPGADVQAAVAVTGKRFSGGEMFSMTRERNVSLVLDCRIPVLRQVAVQRLHPNFALTIVEPDEEV